VVMVFRDGRAEHAFRALLHGVDDAELDHDRPQPRPAGELAPAELKVGEEVRRLQVQGWAEGAAAP